MECFVIFVMAWCWFNATESKPHNVIGYTSKNRKKENMKIYYLVFLLISTISFSQTKKEKTFVGYEPIMWNKDKEGNETNADFENPKQKWYHKNILKIKNDSVFLDRVPVSKIRKKTLYSSSDGGFYYYKGIIIKEHNQTKIELTEIGCEYCPTVVSKNKNEIIPKRKLYGKITEEGIEINNVKINEIEYSEFILRSENWKEN
ncbi:hypothetical protein [Flavobacterium sp.]|uniref:hypothetical protein n=1 Tax=Flavobacterium sp. TaxID=239 RepID=UPI004047A692